MDTNDFDIDFDFEKELQACKEKQTKQLCLLLVVEELVMLSLMEA